MGVRRLEFGVGGFFAPFSGAAAARTSEDMGFDLHAFAENHSRVPDCFGEMRDAVRATSHIKLIGGPVNFVTRDPGVVASAILPLQVLSQGRAICGVAAGDSAVAAVGRRPQSIADLERDLRLLRGYLDGDQMSVGSLATRLEWAVGLEYDRLPIQLVCSGPRSIALAARAADRVCLGIGTNHERVAWALDILDQGLAAAGRDRAGIRIGLFLALAIAPNREQGRAVLRTRVAPWAHMASGRGNDLSQQPEILRRVTSKLRDGYDYRFHRADAPAENPNNDVCDEEFADWMGIGGPPSYVIDRVGALAEMGIDFFMVALPPNECEQFATDVIPSLRNT